MFTSGMPKTLRKVSSILNIRAYTILRIFSSRVTQYKLRYVLEKSVLLPEGYTEQGMPRVHLFFRLDLGYVA